MARYSKTGKVCGLAASVCRILQTLENIVEVEIQARGVQKGSRRVEIPARWKASRLELFVHDEREQCIVVKTHERKTAPIRRILCKRLAQEGIAIAA
jgi:hypothetical protein